MSEQDYLDDLSEIKKLMHRSSRFISLSGLSGIMAGIYAIAGAAFAYYYVLPEAEVPITLHGQRFWTLVIILGSVAILSVVTAALLTTNKARKNNERIWDDTTKRLLTSFLVPLITGGIYILIKLQSQHYGLTASLMLIFYGLALVNASKYTLGTVKFLGYTEIVFGLICAALPGYGFWFWVIGFGVSHIVYGTLMLLSEKQQ